MASRLVSSTRQRLRLLTTSISQSRRPRHCQVVLYRHCRTKSTWVLWWECPNRHRGESRVCWHHHREISGGAFAVYCHSDDDDCDAQMHLLASMPI